MIISVDGGVSLDNALRLKEAGASRLVVGSSLFGSADIRSTLKEFVNL
ncbi:MAG: hypothetical protein HYT43_02120 [Candidatus Taylorbacteria bacterium]|nr:hypothetical protein [Candidatus Taylorbacteria bacterium]